MTHRNPSVEAEIENIRKILSALPRNLSGLSDLELAGVSTYLHNFYGGIENIIKQLFKARHKPLPVGLSWHRDLLQQANAERILSEETVEALSPFLGFRHFFHHNYAIDLNPEKLDALIVAVDLTFAQFIADIEKSTKEC
jgi:hypothetical protein